MASSTGMLPVRRQFVHGGRVVYEWDQSLDEVNVYIAAPPGVPAAAIDCALTVHRVRLGLKGNPPFLDEALTGPIVVGESLWTLDDGVLQLSLTKMRKGATWPSVVEGHGELDAAAAADVQRRMLLERFQGEHPGFDFSGAEVNGAVPDPRTFMRDQ